MRTAGEFIEDYLSHEYDPVKAKAYYERTKKLKGRKPGAGPVVGVGRAPAKVVAGPVKKAASGNRTAMLNERLTRLKDVLGLLESKVAAAQARSGVTGVKKAAATKKTASSTTKETSKDKTSAEKKADAKASAERYEKNAKSETSKGAQAVQDEIEEVQKKIAAARDELAAALAKARASSPKPKAAPKKSPTAQPKAEGGPSK